MVWREFSLALGAMTVIGACSPANDHETRVDAQNDAAAAAPGGRLACQSSIEQYCAGTSVCPPWSAIENDTAFCAGPSCLFQYFIADCGPYRVLERIGDNGRSYAYYDSSSGTLIAILSPTDRLDGGSDKTCSVGPPGGFALPSCASHDFHIPAWCLLDAGADGATQIDNCSAFGH